jgi:hypothetical protein
MHIRRAPVMFSFMLESIECINVESYLDNLNARLSIEEGFLEGYQFRE